MDSFLTEPGRAPPVIVSTWLTVACGAIVSQLSEASLLANSAAMCASHNAFKSGVVAFSDLVVPGAACVPAA